jgi:hypothetical protein
MLCTVASGPVVASRAAAKWVPVAWSTGALDANIEVRGEEGVLLFMTGIVVEIPSEICPQTTPWQRLPWHFAPRHILPIVATAAYALGVGAPRC